jgi:hypothetical protein
VQRLKGTPSHIISVTQIRDIKNPSLIVVFKIVFKNELDVVLINLTVTQLEAAAQITECEKALQHARLVAQQQNAEAVLNDNPYMSRAAALSAVLYATSISRKLAPEQEQADRLKHQPIFCQDNPGWVHAMSYPQVVLQNQLMTILRYRDAHPRSFTH